MRYFGGIPSCEKCWIQVSPVPASDEVCPPVCYKCQNSLSVFYKFEGDKGVANPEGLICENSCDTLGTLMGCEKQLTMNRESFRNHTIAKIAGQSNRTLPLFEGKFGRKDQRGIVGDCTGFVEVISSSFTTDELSEAHHMRYASWHGFVKGILETGGMMDKCVQMWTRNYGALGQTAPELCFGVGQVCPDVDKNYGALGQTARRTGERKKSRKKDRESGRERTDGRRRTGRERRKESLGRERVKPALNEDRAESETGVKKTMNAGGVENGL
ncbi:hypothetical protein TNCV_5083661 [Trichonephila clavipes]|uniref:Uncharacterized protein n=1 Tax=Trichonephila clavipes TaxID=2585209 RepID=A0A8X6VBQ5_TRICX|nr:hypothetical protein TNCV_5083661 [Trichonephila clavipes]